MGAPCRIADPSELRELAPAVDPAACTASELVVHDQSAWYDAPLFVQRLLDRAATLGADIRYGLRAQALIRNGDAVTGVETGTRRWEADWVVNCTGPDADRIAALAERLHASGQRVLPALRTARLAGVRLGVRPVPADGLPLAGTQPGVPGLYHLVTHSGVNLAPELGRLAAQEIIDGDGPDLAADRDHREEHVRPRILGDHGLEHVARREPVVERVLPGGALDAGERRLGAPHGSSVGLHPMGVPSRSMRTFDATRGPCRRAGAGDRTGYCSPWDRWALASS
ncbi:NAD(P)/FAD-dependent oxidoreductase [Nonomuraea angiospora]|uniref:NAD(P)/FAD-dependent oxidoreductase n=1 Tax=Nonomuraea angiospora TaxID=46172 RepID=UPI0029B11109|nr:FAD-dependent oxidoreductase [Nonomuraea angiospora]MDX3101171.1 FAD-dependent oxidoreductase [Nonomuraea angiospora]